MKPNRKIDRKKEEKITEIYNRTPHKQLKKYIKTKKTSEATSTLLQESSEIERYLNFLSPDQTPMDNGYLCNHVTPSQIHDYVMRKRKGSTENLVSPGTAAVRLSILRKFYEFLILNSLNNNLPALRNPSTAVTVPKFVPKASSVISNDLVRTVLLSIITGDGINGRKRESWEKTKFRDFAILSLLFNTGLSLSQLADLNLEDLVFGADTGMMLKYAQCIFFQTDLSAENHLKKLLTSSLSPEDDAYRIIWEEPVYIIVFSDSASRRVHINQLASASLLFYLLLERDALEYNTGALFFSLKRRRMSHKTLENMISKYFAPFSDQKITPELIRKSYAAQIMQNDPSSLPFLAHRMGYQDTSYLKLQMQRSSDDSESADRSIGSLPLCNETPPV